MKLYLRAVLVVDSKDIITMPDIETFFENKDIKIVMPQSSLGIGEVAIEVNL